MSWIDRFPYCDTMWLLENWGPGRLFYGHASEEEVDEIENRLKKGEAFAGLYVEAPGNPLLLTTNLERLRKLSLEYGFPVVIDDTIGSWVNVDSLRFADIVVTSLSKSFNGACNVLAGRYAFLFPCSKAYG